MALSNPRIIYGVHSFTAYDRNTGLPFGTSLVIGNSSFSLSGELVTLQAGSNKYPWAIEDGNITAELSLTFKQYENWMMEVFLGKKPTVAAGSATGTVSTPEAIKGISLLDATTGIASIAPKAGSEADLKFSKFILKAVSATEVDVYAYTNIDFARGTTKQFEDDNLKITASPLTVPGTSGVVEVPGFGLEITGGSGAIAFVVDDTAKIEVLPIDSASMETTFGATNDVYPEFGAILLSQQRGTQEMTEIDVFRAKAIGLPIGMAEKSFSEAEVTAQAYYDSEKGGVFKIRNDKPL